MNTLDFQRALSIGLALAAATTACAEDEETCSGAEILPHLSPVLLGDLYPAKGEPRPGNNERVPFEFSLVLQSTCGSTLVIDEVCIVGDAHNGAPGSTAFEVEPPDRNEVPAGQDALVRITYDHSDVNADQDGDGTPDPDRVALVVQSNAKNFPTLVVPVCARIVEEGATRRRVDCASPITLEPGEADPDLCGGG